MAEIHPLAGIRFNPEVVKLGGVLAPPYDVINPEQQESLYARDLRNIVRIDFGRDSGDDIPGVNDRYTRARDHLNAWLKLGVLRRDPQPSFYVSQHEFAIVGAQQQRRGFFCRVIARPWEYSEVKPHERTLRGPKEDRLALMETTQTQTSAVFAMWDSAPGIETILDRICASPPTAGGRPDGEFGSEKHLLWHVDDASSVATLINAVGQSMLYIADGHHRFETAATYAAKQRQLQPAAPADADFEFALMYLCDGNSPDLYLLPTHRSIPPRSGLPSSGTELAQILGPPWTFVTTDDLTGAVRAAAIRRPTHNAFAVVGLEQQGMLIRPRSQASSPREGLDVVVLETQVLGRLNITPQEIAEGALNYTRNIEDLGNQVSTGKAALGFALNPVTPTEVMAVAKAGDVMPQKSTYFFPKVPTGLVLSPL